ncbi:hypothetical protein [Sphingobium sp. AP50]|uniref:hypothetical protein n=1 Tax=Sphingobium sp. AP50 TaxID=1884369 RepID=UPI000B887D69|nr:hypothetical protein [Sphingobium sp. AP50]
MTAIGMTDAEFPQHVGRDANCARFVILELDEFTPALAVEEMPRYRSLHLTMGVTAHFDSLDAVGEPLQCSGFK